MKTEQVATAVAKVLAEEAREIARQVEDVLYPGAEGSSPTTSAMLAGLDVALARLQGAFQMVNRVCVILRAADLKELGE